MNHGIFVGLMYNAALLMALGIVFDSITLRNYKNRLMAKIITGLCLGIIVIAVMFNPFVLKPGVVFDTRSIILSLTSLFFGTIPTVIAAIFALIFRIIQGGAGVYMGTSVVLASVLCGYIWKKIHKKWNKPYSVYELLSLGLVNHITMLGLTILLPTSIRSSIFHTIFLPVLIIYPCVTVFMGLLLGRRILRRQEKFDLEESERQFRNLYENVPMPYQSLDVNGNFVTVNKAWLEALGYEKDEVIGKNFADFLHPDFKEHFKVNFPNFKAAGHIEGVEFILIRKDGFPILASFIGKILTNEDGSFKQTQCIFINITEQRKQESALRSIEWMLSKDIVTNYAQTSYGDLTELNTNRLILDSVGKDVLKDLVSDYLSLLDTSSAVYEKNGDYAMGIFSSTYCNLLDTASRNLIKGCDNSTALNSGKWLCHESCWTEVSKLAIETGDIVDKECHGGINLYAVPIKTSMGVIGAINIGYGNPPSDEKILKEIADKYQIDIKILMLAANQYQNRPPFIIEQAKRKLRSAARIIGEIVERKQTELQLLKIKQDWEVIFQSIPHPTYILDKNQNIIAANSILESAIGFNIQHIKGKKCWEFMHGSDVYEPPQSCPFSGSCSHGCNTTSEVFSETLNGYYLVTCKPIFDREGNIEKVIHIAMDITDRKKAELILAQSEEKYRLLTETAKDMVIVHQMNGSFTFANKVAQEFLGITPDSMGEVNLWNIIPPKYHQFLKQHIQERNAGFKGTRLYQMELINAQNQRIQVEVCSSPIVSDSETSGILAVIRDITDRITYQKALKDSEEKFRRLVETANEGILTVDENMITTFVNKRLTEMVGYSETELLGQHLDKFIPMDEMKDHKERMEKRQRGKDDHYERRIIAKDGSIIWVLVSAKALLNQDEKFSGSFVMLTDITDIKQAEIALKESETRFTQFMNQIPGNVFIKDKNSRLLYVNRNMDNVHGASAWIGKTPYEVFIAEEAEEIISDDQKVLGHGIKQMIDALPNKSGDIRYYETTKFIVEREGADDLIGGLSLDVTTRVLAEMERNQYAKRLEILHEIDTDILEARSLEQICSASLNYLFKLIPCDRCSVAVWGASKQDWHLFYVENGEFNQLTLPYDPVGDQPQLKSGQILIIPDISEFTGEVTDFKKGLIGEGIKSFLHFPLHMHNDYYGSINFSSTKRTNFAENQIDLVVDIANQMTIAIQQMHLTQEISRHAEDLEVKVEERTAQLESANRELESFSYSVAHDLRSPLRSIDGFANMLIEDYADKLDGEAMRKLEVIKNNATKMDTLIKELLDLAKLNPYSLKYKSLNMTEMATNTINNVLSDYPDYKYKVAIHDLPYADADSVLIQQVWQNLITNAVKFTAPQIVREIEIGSFIKDNFQVYYVRDTGVGFDMKYVDKIFGPFQRLHRSTEFEGTGIGLAIVHKIIQRHNGMVWAESDPGKGSTFFFSLPEVKLS